jgi:hypothetical protein
MNDTIEIGDTFEHETEPGRAWEVTEVVSTDMFRMCSGAVSSIVRGRYLLGLSAMPSRWRRCEARAVCA